MKKDIYRFIDEPLKDRLKKNSLTNILYFVLTLPIMFILTPMIIKATGPEDYGIWVIAGAILVFVELGANFQASSALSVMIPKIDPKKEPEKINTTISTLVVFYMASAVLVCLLYFFAEPLIIKVFFKTSPDKAGLAAKVMALSIYPFMANFIIASFGYLAAAFNIFYMINILHIIIAYLRAGLMVWSIKAGLGITGIVYVQMGTLLLESMIIMIMCKRIFPPLRVSFRLFSREMLSYMLKLSAKLFTAKAANVLSSNYDRIALGLFVNPAAAGIYQLGAGVSRYIANLPEMLGFASLLPAASELKRDERTMSLINMSERVTRYTAFCGIFLAWGIISFGREFIKLWLGQGYEPVFIIMAVLAAAYAVSILSYPMQNILNGTGHEKKAMAAGVISSVVTIVLVSVLSYKMGGAGAAYAALFSALISVAVFNVYYRRSVMHKIGLFRLVYKPALTGLILYIPVYFVPACVTWPVLFLKILVYTVMYLVIVQAVLKLFDPYDIGMINKLFKRK